jgi:hypothetical protein
MAPSPYAPPAAPIPMGGTIDVKSGDTLPLICLKCGRTHDVTPHDKRVLVLGRARVVTLAAAITGGAVVALVHEPQTRMLFFAILAGLAFLARRVVNPRMAMPIALCAPCAHRWASGERWSKVLRAVMVLSSAVATVLMFIEASPLVALLFALVMFGAIAGLLLLRMRTRIIVVKQVRPDGTMTLALLHVDAVAAINSARA